MHSANPDAIFYPMENKAISISLGIHGSCEPNKMVQKLLSGICTANMPLLLTVVSFQMLWLIHIKKPSASHWHCLQAAHANS